MNPKAFCLQITANAPRPVPINPVIVETEEERRLFERGERNSKLRKERARTSLLEHTPNDEESDLIHALWQRQLQYHSELPAYLSRIPLTTTPPDPNDALRKPDNVHFMDATVLRTASIMQPQYRNRHHFMIFGGFLLKATFELAFCAAASFAHTRPTFVSLDPSTFQNPVPVGSVLYLTATITYTDPPLVYAASDEKDATGESRYTRIQVRVDSKVRDVEHGVAKPTGQFNYTFTVDRDIKVMPRTYSEFMMYIDARRRVKQVAASINEQEPAVGERVDAGEKKRVTGEKGPLCW